MPETTRLTIDGEGVEAAPGITVAAALENAGRRACRTSVAGGARGVLCAMGGCLEGRVTIDGVAQQRACMEAVREGMAIETGKSEVSGLGSHVGRAETLECDVAVVGGGPAGIAAACRAAEAGAACVLLDEGLTPGGQIHRRLPASPAPEAARVWLERLARSGATVRTQAAAFAAPHDASGF